MRHTFDQNTQYKDRNNAENDDKIPQSCQIRKYNIRRNIGNQQPVGSIYFLKYRHISIECTEIIRFAGNLFLHIFIKRTLSVCPQCLGNQIGIPACKDHAAVLVHKKCLCIVHFDKRIYNHGNTVQCHIGCNYTHGI